jgi:hypothetical protein
MVIICNRSTTLHFIYLFVLEKMHGIVQHRSFPAQCWQLFQFYVTWHESCKNLMLQPSAERDPNRARGSRALSAELSEDFERTRGRNYIHRLSPFFIDSIIPELSGSRIPANSVCDTEMRWGRVFIPLRRVSRENFSCHSTNSCAQR